MTKCHQTLFSDYCVAHLLRSFRLYPISMTRAAAMKTFVKMYNSALHFNHFETNCEFARLCFVLPPRCLEIDMEQCVDFVVKQHEGYVEGEDKFPSVYREWVDTAMNFDGLEMED